MRQTHVITNSGRIFVTESKAEGLPVLMIHGNSQCANSFTFQLEGEVGKTHRLIAFDLPGHGESSRAENPERTYTLDALQSVIGQVVEQLGIEKPVLVGHSLGGHLALQALAQGFRASGVFVFGTPPIQSIGSLSQAFLPHPMLGALFQEELDASQITGLSAAMYQGAAEVSQKIQKWIGGTDPKVRKILGASLGQGFRNEVEALKNTQIPKAIGLGKKDPLVNLEYIQSLHLENLWKGGICIVENATHCPQLEDPVNFNHLLLEFLDHVRDTEWE